MAAVELTNKQIKFLKTLLGLDLDAMGFERGDIRTAASIKKALTVKPEPPLNIGRNWTPDPY